MKPNRIVEILGASTVSAVENVVSEAFAAAQTHPDTNEGLAAVRELLLTMLAASIITPRIDAIVRAEACAQRLRNIVQESIDTAGTTSALRRLS
jgi:hypothetical protein